MDIYTAVMKAADHIERNPHLFKFTESCVPDCGTPGCALGWISHFLGERPGQLFRAEVALGFEHILGETEFYSRMDHLLVEWAWNAPSCVRALRLYAAKYLAPPKPAQQPPDWNALAVRLGKEAGFVEAGSKTEASVLSVHASEPK